MSTLTPMKVSRLTPLEMPIGKEVLVAVMEDLINNLYLNRERVTDTDDREEIDLMIEQRKQFLSWVELQPGPNVPVAMYPIDEPMFSRNSTLVC